MTAIQARNQLVESNLRLIPAFVERKGKKLAKDMPPEDVDAYAAVGLVEAAIGFDPAKDRKFSTYAFAMMKFAVIRGAEKHRRWSCGHACHQPSVAGLDFAETIPDHRGPDTSRLEADGLPWDRLDGRERDVVESYYTKGEAMCRIAARRGVSKARIYQLRERALAKLRGGR